MTRHFCHHRVERRLLTGSHPGEIYIEIFYNMVNLTKSASLLILSDLILLVILVREV